MVVNYLKNITNSVKFSAEDLLKQDLAPNTMEFVDANKDFLYSAYNIIRHPKQEFKRRVSEFRDSKVYEALDYGVRNVFEDLRSGKFYNKEREDRDTLKFSGMDVGENEFDLDFDFDDEPSSSRSKTTKKDEITSGDEGIINAVNASSAANAGATVNAIIETSSASIKNSRTNTAMLYNQNERLFGGLFSNFSVLNANVDSLLKLSHGTFRNIDENMSKYFTESVKLDTERNDLLRELVELTRKQAAGYEEQVKAEEEKKKKKTKLRWDDISTANGMPDLEAYFANIMDNVKRYAANSEMSAMNMLKFNDDSNPLALFMTSPLKFIPNFLVKSVVPATIKEATRELDATLSNVFATFVAKMNNERDKNEGGLAGMLAKFLSVNSSVNRSLDTNKFVKGPIPFDGVTRKAIVEIIPTYLRRIDAVLSGREEMIFDYNTGRWSTHKGIMKDFENIRKSQIKSATSDMADHLKLGVNKYKETLKYSSGGKSNLDRFDKAMDEFYTFLYNNNGVFNPYASQEKNGIDISNYPNLSAFYDDIVAIYRAAGYDLKNKRNVKYSAKFSSKAVLDAKSSEEKRYRQLETMIGSGIMQVYGGLKGNEHLKFGTEKEEDKIKSIKGQLNTIKDKLGYTVFDYLNKISKELQWQRTYWLYGGGGNGFGPGAGGPPNLLAPTRLTQTLDLNKSFDNIYIPSKLSDSTHNTINRDENSIMDAVSLAKKIKDGKVFDFKDSDYDSPEEFLDKLVNFLAIDYTVEHHRNIKEENNQNELSAALDKIFFKANIKDMDEFEKKLRGVELDDDKDDLIDRDSSIDKEEASFLKGAMNTMSEFSKKIGDIVSAPGEVLSNLMYVADKAIYEMMFKKEIQDDDENEEYDGFVDMISKKIKSTFEDTKETIIKNVIDPLKKRLGISDEDSITDRIKDSLFDIGGGFLDLFEESAKEVYSPMLNFVKESFLETEAAKKLMKFKARNDMTNKFVNTYGIDRETMNNLYDKGYSEEEKAAIRLGIKQDIIYNRNKERQSHRQLLEYSDSDIFEMLGYNTASTLNDKAKLMLDLGILSKDELSRAQASKWYEGNANAFFDKKVLRVARGGAKKDFNIKDIITNRLILSGLAGAPEDAKNLVNKSNNLMTIARYINANTDNIQQISPDDTTTTNARGTFTGKTMLSKNELLFNKDGISRVNKTGAYDIKTPTHILNSEDSYDILKDLGFDEDYLGKKSTISKDLAAENKLKKTFKNGFKFKNHNTGSDGAKEMKIKTKGLDDDVTKQAIKKYFPEGIAGGLVGLITGTILNIFGGPIMGAAIGAGANIIANSEEIKTKLFGPIGSNNKRTGGLVNKETMDTLHKYVPNITKFGLAGLIPGLITSLGPLNGLLIGAGIGLVKSSDEATNKYFGEDGKLKINTKTKNVIKKMIPGAGVGAGAGAVIGTLFGGPFGLLGNAALGAGIGMMSTTDEFKELLFGKKINGVRYGGVLGNIENSIEPVKAAAKNIKDNLVTFFDNAIIDPWARFLSPFIHSIPQVASILPRKILEITNNAFRGIYDKLEESMFGPFIKKIGNFLTNTKSIGEFGKIIGRLNPVGWIGDAIKRRQIKTHNASYMGSATERNRFREEHHMVADNFDIWLSDIGKKGGATIDQAIKMRDLLSNVVSTRASLTSARGKAGTDIYKIMKSYRTEDGKQLSGKTKDAVIRALKNNDLKGAEEALASRRLDGSMRTLTQKEVEELLYGQDDDGLSLSSRFSKFIDLAKREDRVKNLKKEDRLKYKNKLNAIFKKNNLGIDLDKASNHEINKFLTMLDDEIIHKQANKSEYKDKLAVNTKIADDVSEIVNILTDIKRFNKDMVEGTPDSDPNSKHNVENAKMHRRATVARDKRSRKYNRKIEALKAKIGEEAFNNLTPEQIDRFTSKEFNIGDLVVENVVDAFGNVMKVAKVAGLGPMVAGYKGLKIIGEDLADNRYRIGNKLASPFRAMGQGLHNIKTGFFKIGRYRGKDNIQENIDAGNFTYENMPDKAVNLNRISDLRGLGYGDLDKSANNYLTTCSKVEFSNISKILGNKSVYKMFKNNKITEDDLKFAASLNTTDVDNYIKLVRVILKNNKKATFSRLRDVADVDPTVILTRDKGNINKEINRVIGKNPNTASEQDTENQSTPNNVSVDNGGKVDQVLNNTEANTVNSSTNEVDIPGDGKEVAQDPTTGEHYQIHRTKDGGVEPDMSDPQTRDVMKKKSFKEKLMEKLHIAQSKAADLYNKSHDLIDKGKTVASNTLKWLAAVTAGGALVKSGILPQIFNNLIKPVWTDHIKPFITEKAVPWIRDTAIPAIGNVFKQILPTLVEGLKSIIPLIGEAIGELAPVIIDTIVEVAPAIGKAIFDAVTGSFTVGSDTYNAIYKDTKTSTSDISSLGDNVTFTGSDGITYTGADIKAGNVPQDVTLYNSNDGEITLDTTTGQYNVKTTKSSSVAKFIGRNANQSLRTLLTGRTGMAKGVYNLSNKLLKVKTPFKPINALAKIAGVTGKVASSPVVGASKAHNAIVNLINKKKAGSEIVEEVVEKATKKGGSNTLNVLSNKAAKESVEAIGNKALKESLTTSVSNIGREELLEKATKNAAKETTSSAAKTKLIKKITDKLHKGVDALLSSDIVQNKLKTLATSLGESNFGKWFKGFKNTINDIFLKSCKEGIEEGGEKVVAKATKAIGGKVVFIVFLITDFLTGMDQAESMFGFEDTSLVEEVAAGVVNAIGNLLVIPAIFPSIMKKVLTEVYSWFYDDLEERQAEAERLTEEYKKRTGEDISTEDRLKQENSFLGRIGKKIKDGWNDFWGKSEPTVATDSRTGSYGTSFDNSKYGKGGYSKQNNPLIANLRYNKGSDSSYQTLGDSGCGPAAAVNVMEALYGRGNSDVINAAQFALRNGYKETDGGTIPGFFKDYFNSRGVSSEYSTNRSELMSNINSGHPTVLMGKDANGVSDKSPFGTTPHYVTVTGTDKNGRAIVQDPESPYDNQLYDMNDLLSRTKLGVSAGMGTRRNMFPTAKFGKNDRYRYGRGISYSGVDLKDKTQLSNFLKQLKAMPSLSSSLPNNEVCYNFFIIMGFTPQAAAAAVGNLMGESGIDSNGQVKLHTTEVGNNNEGVGIVQWSYGRKTQFLDFCRNAGEPFETKKTSLVCQLAFLGYELVSGKQWSFYSKFEKKYKMSYTEFINSTNIENATGAWCACFERPNYDLAHMDRRIKYAKEIYNLYSGNTVSMDSDIKATSTSGETTTQTNNNSIYGFFNNKINSIGSAISGLTNIWSESAPIKALSSFGKLIYGDDNSSESGDSTSSSTALVSTSQLNGVANGTKVDANTARNAVTGLMQYLSNNKIDYSQEVRNPEKGSADCSSTIRYAYQKTLGIDPGDYTGTQYQNGTPVKTTGVNDIDNLKPGDIVFYKGKNGKVGHVELYMGNGKLLGHGGGKDIDGDGYGDTPGPNEHNITTYRTSDFLGANRYIYDGKEYTFDNKSTLPWISGESSASGTGIKPLSKYGTFKGAMGLSTPKLKNINSKGEPCDPPSGFGSYSYGRASGQQIDYSRLINTIITVLMTIADNTDKLNTIVGILNSKLGTNLSTKELTNNKETLKSKIMSALRGSTPGSTSVDESMNMIINTMNAIASE